MQVDKVKCAEEMQVKLTIFQNLDLWIDDMFIGTKYRMQEKEKQRLMVVKMKCLQMMALEEKAIQILAKREAASDSIIT